MNTVYLVRHAENVANITKEFSHRRVDYSLTPKGLLQAQQTAEYFRERHVDRIYSSPLKRALETAEIIAAAKGLPVSVMDNFREVDAGDLEDWEPTDENWRFYMDVVTSWHKGTPERAFPGGENLLTLRARMREGISRIVEGQSGQSLVVVAHGGIFLGTIADLCPEVTPETIQGDYHNCAVSELRVGLVDGRLQGELVGWGFCEHLSGDAAELVSALPDALAPGKIRRDES